MKKLNSVRLLGLVFIGLLVLGPSDMLSALNADHNRPSPRMDYATQEIGVYDSVYQALAESDCRVCHGASVSDRHHWTDLVRDQYCALPEGCHPAPGGGGITVIRDCTTPNGGPGCHNWAEEVADTLAPGTGNLKWHHNTDLSAPESCISCHNPNLISPINPDWLDLDVYPPSAIIPSVWSCENCHWGQGVAAAVPGFDPSTSPTSDAGHPSTYDHYEWWGEFAGYHEYGTPILGNRDTHHMGGKGLYDDSCGQCHAVIGSGTDRDWDYSQDHPIRYCMQCHDHETAHTIQPHVAGVNGWDAAGFHVPDLSNTDDTDVAPTNYRTFDEQEMCFGCHEQVPTVPPSARPNCSPAINMNSAGISPAMDCAGGVITLSGECFGEEDPCTAGSSVQLKMKPDGDEWIDMPIISWTDTLIEFEIPWGCLGGGNHWVRVKTSSGESNKRVFTLKGCP